MNIFAPLPTNLRLLPPTRFASTSCATTTSRAFKLGAQIHPKRAAYEFYPTPPKATLALLSAVPFDGDIWEPACGQGHISKVLESAGHTVVSTDFAACWGYGTPNRDFLAETKPLAKNIITNPPYGKGLGDAFVRHALALTRQTNGKVAMLLALQSLAHPIRHDFWIETPPTGIYILDDCQCWPYGDPAKATTSIGKQRYCWAVWDASKREGKTTIAWLTTRSFK